MLRWSSAAPRPTAPPVDVAEWCSSRACELQTMSVTDRAAGFGTATPPMPVRFLACAGANQPLSRVPLNVSRFAVS